jgi:hypothetical protein
MSMSMSTPATITPRGSRARRGHVGSALALTLALGAAGPAAARADATAAAPGPSAAPSWLHLEAGTDFPISVGLRARFELPHRLVFVTGLGLLPRVYVKAINGVATSAGWYDDATAELIEESLQRSLVFSLFGGWRPLESRGFYVLGGYRLVALGGGATASEIIGGLTGQELPASERGQPRQFSARSTLHMVGAELGWELRPRPHLVLRAALGVAFTVAARTAIEPDYRPVAPRAVDEFSSYGERYLDETYESYVHVPTLGVSAGYAF